jgi:hypothetical protein
MRTTPARNLAVHGMTQISAGGSYALALHMGQLGNGTTVTDSGQHVLLGPERPRGRSLLGEQAQTGQQ